MKAYLKSDRKVIVDVTFSYVSEQLGVAIYTDKSTGKCYNENNLDWVEYYGG